MNDKKSNQTLNNLESIVKRILLIHTHNLFFPELNAFCKRIFKEKLFISLFRELYNEFINANNQLITAKKDALEELRSIENKIRSYVLSCKTVDRKIIYWLDKAQKKIEKDEPLISSLEFAVFNLLHDPITNHDLFMQSFGEIKQINDCKYISIKDIFPKYHAWINQRFYVNQKNKESDSYSLHVLYIFYERYDAEYCDQLIEQLSKKNINTLDLESQHNEIIRYTSFKNQIDSQFFPTMEEYKIHVQRIFDRLQTYLLDNLLNIEFDKQPQNIHTNIVTIIIRGSAVTVKFNGKSKTLNTNNRSGRLIKALAKHPTEAMLDKDLWYKVGQPASREDFGESEEKSLNEARKSTIRLLKQIGLSKYICHTPKKKHETIIQKTWFNSDYITQILTTPQ